MNKDTSSVKKEGHPFPFLELLVLLVIFGIAYFGYLKRYPEEKEKIFATATSAFKSFTASKVVKKNDRLVLAMSTKLASACKGGRKCDPTLGGKSKKKKSKNS